MPKTIVIDPFDTKSIEQALNETKKEITRLKKFDQELAKAIATKYGTECSANFARALYPGENDVTVTVEQMSRTEYAVHANGEAVCFIEFGTGVFYNGGDSYPGVRPTGVVGIGQYGRGQGKHERWFYRGSLGSFDAVPSTKKPGLNITHGNPANACMWNASRKIRSEFMQIVKEVWEKCLQS